MHEKTCPQCNAIFITADLEQELCDTHELELFVHNVAVSGGYCGALSGEGFVCTKSNGHLGNHEAESHEKIVAVWINHSLN